jgi:hypothetical protein
LHNMERLVGWSPRFLFHRFSRRFNESFC